MSNLLEIRKKFVQISGRYDLASSVVDTLDLDNSSNDWADKGADWYIQGGQRFLDRQVNTRKEGAELTFSIVSGNYLVTLPAAVRVVKAAALLDGTEDQMVYLKKRTVRFLREEYGGLVSSLASVERDRPEFYAPSFVNRTSLVAANATSIGTVESQRQLMFMPPSKGSYTLKVEVAGNTPLSADSHVNYWTREYPQLLVWAALYVLERAMNNREGARGWLEAMQVELDALDNDLVEEAGQDTEPIKSTFDYIVDRGEQVSQTVT